MNLKRVVMGLKSCDYYPARCSCSNFIIFVILVLDYSTSTSYGHLASVMDDSNNGEPRSPLLQHSREARGPSLYSSESINSRGLGPLSYLKPPSYQHKYLSSHRLAKFHQPIPDYFEGIGGSGGGGGLEPDINFAKLLQGMSSSERNQLTGSSSSDAGGNGFQTSSKENGGASGQGPTFTPYISARALSNMEKFFHHLRENLEALQKDDEEENNNGNEIIQGTQPERRDSKEHEQINSNVDFSSLNGGGGTGTGGFNLPERDGFGTISKYLISHSSQSSPTTAEWKPMASGVLGLKKIRSFFPLGDGSSGMDGGSMVGGSGGSSGGSISSRTTKFGTNLGIGK